ncbi:hypothetical protein QTP88_005589 [Uroleucon formosanum]
MPFDNKVGFGTHQGDFPLFRVRLARACVSVKFVAPRTILNYTNTPTHTHTRPPLNMSADVSLRPVASAIPCDFIMLNTEGDRDTSVFVAKQNGRKYGIKSTGELEHWIYIFLTDASPIAQSNLEY